MNHQLRKEDCHLQATVVTKERTRTDGPRAGLCTRAEFFKGSAALAAVAAAQTSEAAPAGGIFAGMTGMHAPLFTPLDREGRVVEDRVAPVMEWLLANGMRGFYVTGGTGEGVKMHVLDMGADLNENGAKSEVSVDLDGAFLDEG